MYVYAENFASNIRLQDSHFLVKMDIRGVPDIRIRFQISGIRLVSILSGKFRKIENKNNRIPDIFYNASCLNKHNFSR